MRERERERERQNPVFVYLSRTDNRSEGSSWFHRHKSSGGWKIGGVQAYPRERTANGRLVPIRERCNRLNGSVRREPQHPSRDRERESPGFERGVSKKISLFRGTKYIRDIGAGDGLRRGIVQGSNVRAEALSGNCCQKRRVQVAYTGSTVPATWYGRWLIYFGDWR